MPNPTIPVAGGAMLRRGFLRQLCTLPMLGGSIALIGAPVAVAEPVTPALFHRYAAWIAREHVEVIAELTRFKHRGDEYLEEYVEHDRRWAEGYGFFRTDDAIARAHPMAALPSTRAALVLSAVGCDWRGQ